MEPRTCLHQTCDIFTQPSFSAVGRLRFEAVASFTLDPATTYTVVFYSGSGDTVSLGGTSSIAEDASSLAGWSIRDKFHHQDSLTSNWADPRQISALSGSTSRAHPRPRSPTLPRRRTTPWKRSRTRRTPSARRTSISWRPPAETRYRKSTYSRCRTEGTLALSGTAVTAGDEISKTEHRRRESQVHARHRRNRSGLRKFRLPGGRQLPYEHEQPIA